MNGGSVPPQLPPSRSNDLRTYPTPEALKAIEDYFKTGAWPKPGVLPVCIRLPRGLR